MQGMGGLIAIWENTTCHTAQLGRTSGRKACGLTPGDEVVSAQRSTGPLRKGSGYEVGEGGFSHCQGSFYPPSGQ